MKQSLQLKVSQSLTLTPQLQQSIRLLQLSTLELQAEIEQALNDNPMLERADDDTDEGGGEGYEGESSTPSEQDIREFNASDSFNESETKSSDQDSVQRDSIDQFGDNWEGDWRDNSGTTPEGDEEKPGLQLAAPESSLQQHLLEQLNLTKATERDRNLVMWLIDYVNDDGYLTIELEDLWETLADAPDLEFDELVSALRLLQSFDPTGVGARSASECLLLQMAERSEVKNDPDFAKACRGLIQEHLGLLAQRDYVKIKKALDIDDDMLRRCHQLIQLLEPFPGGRFRRSDEEHIIPDVIVKRKESQWHVQLNPEVVPKLRINEMYASILRSHRGQSSQLSAQLQEARWLLKNVQQRFDTILRVSQAIVERQIGYFNHGEIAMQPLVLREIADQLGLHESTVSRVTTQKYMLTPYGLVELKYFFGSHVSTDSGGQASSTAIRALIKQLIASEDPKKPISDSQIADLLGQQGIVVARRTVAKYRESLKIPPVNMRKSL